MAFGVQVAIGEGDPAVLAHHIRGTSRIGEQHADGGVLAFHDVAVVIGGDWKLALAFADRKFVQRGDVVMADPDHAGAQRLVLRHGGGKVMRLEGAALGEGGGIEIDHHRAFLQRVGEMEGELFAAQAGGGREIRRLVPDLEGGRGRRGGQQQRGTEKKFFISIFLFGGAPPDVSIGHAVFASIHGGCPDLECHVDVGMLPAILATRVTISSSKASADPRLCK